MTTFLRLLSETDKAQALRAACANFRDGTTEPRYFEVAPEAFDAVPGKPFAYWVSQSVRNVFFQHQKFESDLRIVRQGGVTGNDERFLRLWWETSQSHTRSNDWKWMPFAKGGSVSRWYSDFPVVAIWDFSRTTFGGYTGLLHRPSEKPSSAEHYFKGGLTWPLRAAHFAPVPLPVDSIFSIRGYAILAERTELMAIAALCNSTAFDYIFKVALGRFGFPEFVVGILQNLPIPSIPETLRESLVELLKRAWSLKRKLDTVMETSHAFTLPGALRARLGDYDPPAIEAELAHIQARVDAIAFDLYGFAEADRCAAIEPVEETRAADADDDEADILESDVSSADALQSWAVGVAFGRFDWRLATGERAAPPDPDPFDPLPAKSPGMLPDGTAPFYNHAGILVDDQGHPHDLAHLVEEALGRVDMPVPDDVRRWLQRDFFAFHLQRYSKSRRKAPIYWPLATASGSYTLWLYYPSLSSQTLYSAINDFVEPKLKEVGAGGTALRNKGSARTRDEEKQFETLQAFELELIELRDTLLGIAQGYQPNHDDGVQITAAPLWPLFRHKPWQKVLKDTWAKLEKGDYDWAHLAMNYWPARVREKCKTDKSLAIAHDLEALYVEPEAKPKKTRGKKNAGAIE
jgi:hypothetical protein